MRGAAVAGAGTALGPLVLSACHGLPHHVCPESIDNTGTQNVSGALSDWLATTGAPGDMFELRPMPDGTPGRYWIPQGIEVLRRLDFDQKGCHLFTGTTLGSEDPDLEANRLAFPPLYADQPFDHSITRLRWPNARWCVLIGADNVRWFSSVAGARIQGAARRATMRALGREPSGIAFDNRFEGQHAIRLGRNSTGHLATNCTVDLTNLALEFVHADGVSTWVDSHDITIKGRRLGRAVVGGPASPTDRDSLNGLEGGLGGVFDPVTQVWTPTAEVYPGIHHVGRQGVALAFRMQRITLDGFSMWRTGRTLVDLEPGGVGHVVDTVTIRRLEFGIHQLGVITAGARECNNVTVEQNISYDRFNVNTRSNPPDLENPPRHANWVVKENWGGLRCRTPGAGPIILDRMDGAEVFGNYHVIDADVQGVEVTRSTGVDVGTNEFPVSTTSVPAGDPPPGPWS